MTLPPNRIGDKGRRYEIRCKDINDNDVLIGWSDSPTAFQVAIDKHPGLHSRYVVDRNETKAKSQGTSTGGPEEESESEDVIQT